MKIRNKHLSPIGFGSVTVLPDAVSPELPREFNENHPVVKFYLSRSWVEVVSDAPTKAAAQSVGVNIEPPAPENNNGTGELAKKLKEVAKMNLDPLKAEATKLSIEFPPDATRTVLIDLITKKLQTEQG